MRFLPSSRWLGLSLCFALIACGSSADDTGGDNGGDTGAGDTSGGGGDSSVKTDTRTDTMTSDSSKDGNADTNTSDTATSDTTTSDTTAVDSTSTDTGSGTDTTTGTDTRVVDTTPDITPTDVVLDVPVVDVVVDASCAGIQCAGFPASFVTGCTVDDNCIGEMHEADCCGAMHVIGMNHSEASKFCAAEYGADGGVGCRAEYPSPAGCSSDVITADDGETTTDPTKVAVHCVTSSTGGTCKTFVCGTAGGTPCPTARRIGTCGP